MIEEYSSSEKRLVSWFKDSRNKWKERALKKQKELRKAGIKIRDLEKSREEWKKKAKEYKEKSQELEEEKSLLKKKGEVKKEAVAKNHSYSLRTMAISLKQIIISGNSLRGVERNWQIEKEEKEGESSEKIPSYSVIRQWLGKIGLYEIKREKEKRDDWIWIIDLTIELGTEKCLLILGVTGEMVQKKLQESNGCLSHKEVEVLGIEIMKSTKGEKIELVLEKIGKKVGVPQQIISDKGSDLYKGIKLYQEKHQKINHSHDITHQMALLLKKELEARKEYEEFAQKCSQTRQQIQQTEIGYLMPPQQRSKSRYFNLDELIKWGINIIKYLDSREKKEEESEKNHQRLLSKLEWLAEYEESLFLWQEMILMTRNLETKIKKEGLSKELVKEFEQNYQPKLETEKINQFRQKIQRVLSQEISIIGENEIRIFSSDIIESLFGKYKLFSQKSPLKEIRRTILTIPLATLEITKDFIKQALSNIKNSDVIDWEKENFGQSQLSKRKIALNL